MHLGLSQSKLCWCEARSTGFGLIRHDLDVLVWPVAPPHPAWIGFRSGLLCRPEWWRILVDFRLLTEEIFHTDDPLPPYVTKSFEQSSHACLADAVHVAALGGLPAEQEDGAVRLGAALHCAELLPASCVHPSCKGKIEAIFCFCFSSWFENRTKTFGST